MRALWLPDVLRDAGLKVSLQAGWESRGRELSAVEGVIGHHTAGPRTGECPSLRIVTNGRPDLPGPLAQLLLGRSGTWYVVAAGRANHAGLGIWPGLSGNRDTIGIEAESAGNGDSWPAVQMDSYVLGVAAILRFIQRTEARFCTHYEFARPSGRKIDPRGPWISTGPAGSGDWYSGGTWSSTSRTATARVFRDRVRAVLEDDDVTIDEAVAVILARLDELFGIDAGGQPRDLRKKIDAIYVDTHGEDHRELLAGRVAAIDETVNGPLSLDPAPPSRTG